MVTVVLTTWTLLRANAGKADAAWGCTEWHADSGQDRYVYDHFFSYLNYDGRQPFYVEAGANDGLMLSNTAAFELCFGWSGLLVEPDPRAFHKIADNRPQSLAHHGCLSNHREERTLTMLDDAAEFEGNEGVISTTELAEDESPQKLFTGIKQLQSLNVQCESLGTLLKKLDVEIVDYLSLDVEGGELRVLQGINWETGPCIHLISVELSPLMGDFATERHSKVNDFLIAKGYKLLKRLGADAFYLRHGCNLAVDWIDCSTGLPQILPDVVRSRTSFSNFIRPLQMAACSMSRAMPRRLAELMQQKLTNLNARLGRSELMQQKLTILNSGLGRLGGRLGQQAPKESHRNRTKQAEDVVFISMADSHNVARQCPLGALAARLLLTLQRADDDFLVQYVNSHEILYTTEEIARVRQRLPSYRDLPTGGRVLPLPQLFLEYLDFNLVLRSDWPIFEVLDALSWKLKWVVGVLLFSTEPGPICDPLDVEQDMEQELGTMEACGMLIIIGKRIRSAEAHLKAAKLTDMENELLGIEVALKAAADRRGLYWLLYHTGYDYPTVWHQLAELGSTLRSGSGKL